MSITTKALADLKNERLDAQLTEAKELLRHRDKHQDEIKKINRRLDELDADADPVAFDYKTHGDNLTITLGRQFKG